MKIVITHCHPPCEGDETISATERADGDFDESIVSSKVAESAVWNYIVKMSKIASVSLQVALKDGDEAKKFTFSPMWTPPSTLLWIATGLLARVNVTFVVADANLSVEDLLIGLPVLRDLYVGTKTLIEEHQDVLDGVSCSWITTATTGLQGGEANRLIIALINRVANDAVQSVA